MYTLLCAYTVLFSFKMIEYWDAPQCVLWHIQRTFKDKNVNIRSDLYNGTQRKIY